MDYPENLPDFNIGKNLSVRQGFLHSDVFSGCYNTEHFTRDENPAWSVTVLCKSDQTQDFEAFIDGVKSRPFNKFITTMWGRCEYEVVIIKQPTEPRQLSDNVFEYSFSIIAQQINTKFDNIDRDLWQRYSLDFANLDLAINDVIGAD